MISYESGFYGMEDGVSHKVGMIPSLLCIDSEMTIFVVAFKSRYCMNVN